MDQQTFEKKLAAREAAMASELSFVRSRAQSDREALQARLTHADREVANCHAHMETMRSKLEAVGAAKDAELTFVRREQSARVADVEKRLAAAMAELRVLRETASTSQRTLEARSAAHDAELRFVIDRHRKDAANVAETERKLDDALDHNKALLAVQKALRRDLQSATDRLTNKINHFNKLKAKPAVVSPKQPKDLAEFLRSRGLERHLDAFLAQDLDTVDDLKLLNDEDWKMLGLPLGPTRKLQVTIEQQLAEEPADAPVEEDDDPKIDDSTNLPAKPPFKKKKKKFKKPFVKGQSSDHASADATNNDNADNR